MTHFLIRAIIYYGATNLARTDDNAQKCGKWLRNGGPKASSRVWLELEENWMALSTDETWVKTTSFVSAERGG